MELLNFHGAQENPFARENLTSKIQLGDDVIGLEDDLAPRRGQRLEAQSLDCKRLEEGRFNVSNFDAHSFTFGRPLQPEPESRRQKQRREKRIERAEQEQDEQQKQKTFSERHALMAPAPNDA